MYIEKIFALILIPILLIIFFVFLIISGPRKIDYSSRDSIKEVLEVPKEIDAFRLESLKYEGKFEELASFKNSSDLNTSLLLKAIELQKKYLNELTHYNKPGEQRLSYLMQRYDQVMSESIYQESLEKESLSKDLYTEGEYRKASDILEEAISLQKKINKSYQLSTYYSVNRVAQLSRNKAHLKAYPLHQEILEIEALVEELSKQEKWEQAAKMLSQAINKQMFLNSNYRSSDLADSFKVNNLKQKKLMYFSMPFYLKVNDLENKADALMETGDHSNASAYYEEAMLLQEELIESFPDSPYSSTDRAKDLKRKKQTAGSYDIGELINELNYKIDNNLRQRKTLEAKNDIMRISDAMQRMDEEFPGSSYNDEELKSKIDFLNLMRNDINLIHDKVYESIRPVPGEPGLRMLNTELSQALYSVIAGYNPSRYIGDSMPVESVSWKEANDFCQRLSWIMGLRVRLPKEHEFRAAIGRLRYLKLEEYAITNIDGGNLSAIASKDPLGKGFYDLLGNVSEWLYSDGVFENEPVKHIGGHFNDRIETQLIDFFHFY